jgi:hypothetical protein
LTQERLGLAGTQPESTSGRLSAGEFFANQRGSCRLSLVLHGPLVHELGLLQHTVGQRNGIRPGRAERVGRRGPAGRAYAQEACR